MSTYAAEINTETKEQNTLQCKFDHVKSLITVSPATSARFGPAPRFVRSSAFFAAAFAARPAAAAAAAAAAAPYPSLCAARVVGAARPPGTLDTDSADAPLLALPLAVVEAAVSAAAVALALALAATSAALLAASSAAWAFSAAWSAARSWSARRSLISSNNHLLEVTFLFSARAK